MTRRRHLAAAAADIRINVAPADVTQPAPARSGAHRLAIMVMTAMIAAGCSSAADDDLVPTGRDPQEASAAATAGAPTIIVNGTIATGLAAPWSVAFLPGGSALVSERDDATVVHLTPTTGVWERSDVGRIDGVFPDGEGGLLGLATAPAQPAVAAPGTGTTAVFVYWSTPEDNRVGVASWDGSTLSQPEVILAGIPHAGIHDGGRMVVGPDGMLYIGTGDAGQSDAAQDPSSLAGKVLRIAPDGSIPPDNPNPTSPVYSFGHRNIQGLAFDADGRLWASEFGATDVDELNLIVPGGNYGWPVHEGAANDPAYLDPAAQWRPTSVASPSGMAIARGSAWVAGLRGETLWQVPLDGTVAGTPIPRLANQFGRLRDVVNAPDGSLWLVTNNTDGRGAPGPDDDRIIRLVPESTGGASPSADTGGAD